MQTDILGHQIHGVSIGIQKADGYVNATKACEAYKVATGKVKKPNDWLKTDRSKAYVAYVSAVTNILATGLVVVRRGGTRGSGSIWTRNNVKAVSPS